MSASLPGESGGAPPPDDSVTTPNGPPPTGREERLKAAAVADHFVVGIYPFFHGVDIGDEPTLRRDGEQGRQGRPLHPGLFGASGLWAPWLSRLPEHETLGALGAFDDSYFFLPHVRSFLYPEFHGYDSPAPDVLCRRLSYDDSTIRTQLGQRVVEMTRLANEDPGSFARVVSTGRSVHLTLRPDILASLARLDVTTGGQPPGKAISARVAWIDLWLFPYGVGQVVLLLQEDRGETHAAGALAASDLAWMDALLARLALVHPRYVGDTGHAHVKPVGATTGVALRTLLDFLLQGVAGLLPRGPEKRDARDGWSPETSLAAYAEQWTKLSSVPGGPAYGTLALPYSLTDAGQVHGARLLTYAYARTPATGADPGLGIPGWSPASGFQEAWQQIGLDTALRQPWLRSAGPQPDGDDSYRLNDGWVNDHGLPGHSFRRYGNWAAVAYHESFLAVALESDGFTSTYDFGLSKNLYHDYLQLYIYVVFVRFALLRFTERMQSPAPRTLRRADAHEQDAGTLERLRRLHEHFLLFRRAHWFARATSRDQGEELRALMMNALGVSTDYAHIEQTLDDVVEALEVRGERERNVRLQFLTVWFAPLTLVLALFSTKLVDTGCRALDWGLFLALGVGALAGTRWLVSRRSEPPPTAG